jgi:hypothetical protein
MDTMHGDLTGHMPCGLSEKRLMVNVVNTKGDKTVAKDRI